MRTHIQPPHHPDRQQRDDNILHHTQRAIRIRQRIYIQAHPVRQIAVPEIGDGLAGEDGEEDDERGGEEDEEDGGVDEIAEDELVLEDTEVEDEDGDLDGGEDGDVDVFGDVDWGLLVFVFETGRRWSLQLRKNTRSSPSERL
jgi:hypothetical protein